MVNMALTQEDCIMAHRAEKRKTPTGPSSVQPPKYRVIPNAQCGRTNLNYTRSSTRVHS
jgi:hypothetical protein